MEQSIDNQDMKREMSATLITNNNLFLSALSLFALRMKTAPANPMIAP